MSSEVADLRRRIALECEAMRQALYGPAVVARHEIIAHRFQAIGQHQEQLTRHLGAQEAQRITCETYAQVFGSPDG